MKARQTAAIRAFATFGLIYIGYLILVFPADGAEMWIGLAASGVSAAAVFVFRSGEKVQFCPSVRDLLQCWRIPAYVLEGAYQLFRALLLQLLGIQQAGSSMRAVRFSGTGTACRSSARAALAELYTTMTPNSIVLGISHEEGVLLMHQVIPGEVRQMLLNLGGRL